MRVNRKNDFEETIDRATIKDTKQYFSNRKELIRKIKEIWVEAL